MVFPWTSSSIAGKEHGFLQSKHCLRRFTYYHKGVKVDASSLDLKADVLKPSLMLTEVWEVSIVKMLL